MLAADVVHGLSPRCTNVGTGRPETGSGNGRAADIVPARELPPFPTINNKKSKVMGNGDLQSILIPDKKQGVR
jgi:hypothetical protein